MTSRRSARPTDNTLYALTMPGTSDMQRPHITRSMTLSTAMALVACTLLFTPALLHAQMRERQRGGSTLPDTPPAPTPAPVTQPLSPPTPAQNPPSRANVTYANGLLSISAANSSLNQILREISRLTGMKITGGVVDERVYGTYGPASPGKILASLLEGTGSNMLLIQSPAGDAVSSNSAPAELVLTPRHGGPTPPNPNAPGFNDGFVPENRQPPQTIMNRPLPPPSTPVDASQASNPDARPTTTIGPPPATTPTEPTPPATQDQSPNGVKTPQQIYDQLLKLRQQQQAPPSN